MGAGRKGAVLWSAVLACGIGACGTRSLLAPLPDREDDVDAAPPVACPAGGPGAPVPSTWVWENPLPHGNQLTSVWADGAGGAWVVGTAGTVERWDGIAWVSVERAAAEGPRYRAVWGSAADDVWAIDDGTTVRHWTPAGRVDLPTPAGELNALAVCGPSDVWVIEAQTNAWHWDGAAWTAFPLPLSAAALSPAFFPGAWCSPTGEVWAAGGGLSSRGVESIVLRWDGTAWTRAPLAIANWLFAIWGDGTGEVWAVGDRGAIVRGDGAGWSTVPSGTANDLYSVWGNGAGDRWAVGDGGTVLRWDGAAWRLLDAGTSVPLLSVGGDAGGVWIVGNAGALLHGDGSAFTDAASGLRTHLSAVWGNDDSDLWAVGFAGTILHSDGGGTWQAVPSGTARNLYAVWGLGPQDVWVGGEGGTILHGDGAVWTPTPAPASGIVWNFWGSAPNDVWAAGDGILHWDGSVWSSSYSGTWGPVSIWGTAAGDVWAVGYPSLLLHWDGAGWTVLNENTGDLGDEDGWHAVWADCPTDVWIFGPSSIRRWDGALSLVFDSPPDPIGYPLYWMGDVWATAREDIWVVGGVVANPVVRLPYDFEQSTVLHGDGATWTDVPRPTENALASAWTSGHDVWVVGTWGTILRGAR